MMSALAQPSLARLLRSPRPLLAVVAWCVLALGFALATRAHGTAHGADHALVDVYGALVLPLLAYSLVGAVLGARSLSASSAPLVLFGAAPARAAGATAGVAVIACMAVGAAMAAVIALVAHGISDPPAEMDALAGAFAGAMGGGGYAAWFLVGASFGKRGGGRTALLVVDWVVGLGRGMVALTSPRAHVRNLLGGTAPMDWSGKASATALAVMTAVCLLVAVQRAARSSRR